jgi:apolipoprotein N-acyltransferase
MQLGKLYRNKWLLSLASPLLLLLAWPASGFAPLLFVAFIPLLQLEDLIATAKKSGHTANIFASAYLAFIVFNLLTTWWIWYASPFGMFGAVFANALLMTIVFIAFHQTRLQFGNTIGYLSLPLYWMGFEFFHMDWDLTWPWLNLGNGFAAWANMVQWYEYTGTQGGTLWILSTNIAVFHAIKAKPEQKSKWIYSSLGLVTIPLLLSALVYLRVNEDQRPVEVVVVQPNIDPYNEKFSGNSREQLEKILRLAEGKITPATRLVVCPETALPDGIWNEEINEHPQILRIRDFLHQHPNIRFLTGLSYYRLFLPGEPLSETARAFRDGPGHFDAYNAAIQIQKDKPFQFHYKGRLVPGVEKMPFPAVFGYLENFAIDLGGTAGSLGSNVEPSVFSGDSIVAAPVICYESVYGDYIGEYVRKGANLICIMTNDGWWEDTPGYRQHCQYARLRAIEHRRSIARSANTGISCFIDQKGEIHQATGWWQDDCIRAKLNLNSNLTFYSRYGDLGGISSAFLSLVLLTALMFAAARRRL